MLEDATGLGLSAGRLRPQLRCLQDIVAYRNTVHASYLELSRGRIRVRYDWLGLCVLTSVEGVLIICAWLVRNLNARSSVIRIFEQINVRSLIKAMVRWLRFGWAIEIVDIPEAIGRGRE